MAMLAHYMVYGIFHCFFFLFLPVRCYASAVLAIIVCLSVRRSVTSQRSTKTAKPSTMQTTLYDSPGTLDF